MLVAGILFQNTGGKSFDFAFVYTIYLNHHDDHPESHTKNEGHRISLYLHVPNMLSFLRRLQVCSFARFTKFCQGTSVVSWEGRSSCFCHVVFSYTCGRILEDAWNFSRFRQVPHRCSLTNWYCNHAAI